MACESLRIPDAGIISNNLQHPTPRDALGLLGALPTEVRLMIYTYVLGFKHPVSMRTARYLTFSLRHLRECPARKHQKCKLTLTCTNRFDANDVDTIEPPRSVLELLLVSKQIKQEALPTFFENSFVFDGSMGRFPVPIIDSVARFEMVQDVTFLWSSDNILNLVRALYRLPLLRILALIIEFHPHWQQPRSLANKSPSKTRGFEELSHLRGLEKVELAGSDLIGCAGGGWEKVDINHPAAIGPHLRLMLMRPKPPGYEEDLKFRMEALG
ncbi:MAG: hypothetical protein Q9207_004171, partial [Kuettlingeria erythrocarpa]